jgi:hypothetical protein
MTEELIILTDDNFELEEGERGWDEPIRRGLEKLREIKLDPVQLEAQMSNFVGMVGRIFRHSNAQISLDSGLQLEEVELTVKINTKGQIQLIAGGEIGGEGGITLKFKRSDSKTNGK